MKTPALSLNYLIRPPKKTLTAPPLILLLHGVGSNEQRSV